MIELRKATPADAELLARTRLTVWEETYRGIYPDEMLDGYDVAYYTNRDKGRLEDSRHHFYLYMEGETCVGYFSFGPYNFGSYKDFDLCLNNLYIRKGYKGLGLGNRAFAIVRAYCASQGISKFFCGCNAHNHPAMSFYRHMGGILGDLPQSHENLSDDIVHFEFYLSEEPDMIQYRKALPQDALLLAATRKKSLAAAYRGIYPDDMIDDFDYTWHTAREEKNLQNPNIHTYLVMDGEECSGYFTYILRETPLWRDFHVRLLSLYLLPPLQGKGHGRKIFEFVREQCRAQGYTKLWLSCHPQNTNAMAFYRHMGGRIIAEDVGRDNALEDSVEYEFDFSQTI